MSRLPPEFARAERFDGIFMLDLPVQCERDTIWSLYLRQYELDQTQKRPCDIEWTGAEIKSCCRLAASLDFAVGAGGAEHRPRRGDAAEAVSKLRTWASGHCLSADQPRIYRSATSKPRRNVARDKLDPLQN